MANNRTEFHVHTKYSGDSLMSKRLLLLMCRVKRINCLVITDHNEIEGAVEYKPYFETRGIQVIVGEEIFTDSGEIIGLFLKDKIDRGLPVCETISLIHQQDGIVYLPHPYDEKRNRSVLKPYARKMCSGQFDIGEVHNGRNAKIEYSKRQNEIIEELGIVPCVGSDAHCFFEVGRNYVLTEESISRENILEQLSKGEFHQKNCLAVAHQVTKAVKAIKIISKGGIRGLYRALNSRTKNFNE